MTLGLRRPAVGRTSLRSRATASPSRTSRCSACPSPLSSQPDADRDPAQLGIRAPSRSAPPGRPTAVQRRALKTLAARAPSLHARNLSAARTRFIATSRRVSVGPLTPLAAGKVMATMNLFMCLPELVVSLALGPIVAALGSMRVPLIVAAFSCVIGALVIAFGFREGWTGTWSRARITAAAEPAAAIEM
eukprot:2655305-Prymnesium_polylepis.2